MAVLGFRAKDFFYNTLQPFWIPLLLLACVHIFWRKDDLQLNPRLHLTDKQGNVAEPVAQCETGLIAAQMSGHITEDAMHKVLPKCYALAEKYPDKPAKRVYDAIRMAHKLDAGNSPLFGKIAPPMPPTAPPSPTCDASMKHAQLEYSRNKHCDFLPSFAKESGVVSKANKKGRITFGTKKVPADLAVQAFAKSNTIEGECRIISLVGTTPEGRAFEGRVHNEMLASNRKENCDVRLYETDKQMLIDNRKTKAAYNHMGVLIGKKKKKETVDVGKKQMHAYGAKVTEFIDLETKTPDGEWCSSEVGLKLGFCINHAISLVHVDKAAADIMLEGGKTMLKTNKIASLVFDGTFQIAKRFEDLGFYVYLVGDRDQRGREAVFLRIDGEWSANGAFAKYVRGNEFTFMALLPSHGFNEYMVENNLMVCDAACECKVEAECSCKNEGGQPDCQAVTSG
jgi:hypothetical protein